MIFSHFGGSGLALRPILRISGAVVTFSPKKSRKGYLRTPPQRQAVTPFFRVVVLLFFSECFFLILVILSAQRLHFGIHFDTFLGALGLFKNSWKCVSVINFRGLTPSGPGLLAGLDRECVLIQFFFQIFAILGGFGETILSICWIIFVKKKMLKNRAATNSKEQQGTLGARLWVP